MSTERRQRIWVASAIALVLLKLWLVAGQTIFAIGPSDHDDRLFVKLAGRLLEGDWLGPYNQFTLAKGPAYSIFIALVFLSGLPLFTAQHLFYAAACAVLVRTLRPWMPGNAWRWALFVVLLFNPMTFEANVHLRLLRQQILHSLALLTLAGLLGLIANRGLDRRREIAWGTLAGTAFAGFWMTREETIWLAPLVAALLGWAAWSAWRERRGWRDLLPPLAPVACFLLLVGGVSALNWRHYGVFTVCEFRSTDFKDAYGALCRVIPAQRKPFVPVTRETRERIYAVSPAFAELRPFLEGQLGTNWANVSTSVTGEPAEKLEIGGGWLMWALRDAITDAGHGKSGRDAMAFYRRLADEVNAACDQGKIPALGRRSGFLPPLSNEDLPGILALGRQTAWYFFSMDGLSVQSPPSVGPAEKLDLYRSLVRGRLTPTPEDPPLPRAQRIMDGVRLKVLGWIGHCYRALILPAGTAALAACFWLGFRSLRRRSIPVLLLCNAGILAALAPLILISTLVSATSFPALHPGAFTAGYPLWILFLFTAWRTHAEPDQARTEAAQ